MARGYPDWYRGFEVFGGTMRLKVFPGWGHAQRATYSGTPVIGDYRDLVSLSGQGIYYGGRMSADGAASRLTDLVRILIDGNTFEDITLADAIKYGKGGAPHAPIKVVLINAALFIYYLDLKGDYVFESSFKLQYKPVAAGPPTVNASVYYAMGA